ncbi:prolipoprotein diacylglyceryl transferase [Eubacterium infirmum F0142]|nr:prolipoprotein diacylglyceryl transferase [Eubacterium infirmum F0142]
MQAPNPIAFTIAGIDIRWYGILIGVAFLLAIYISYLRAPKFGIVQDDILDLTIFLIPCSIIGARAYYVIFSYDNYRGNFIQMLNLRAGGLAIHGGIIAGVIVSYIVAKRKKIKFSNLADLIMPQVALAQAIGRWGNFFNSEAHGGPTNLPWAITVYGEKVHPTFLYESIWCFFIFILLIFLSNKIKYNGQIALLYAMLYSFERFWVEGLRTDSLMIGQFRQAQVLSLVVFILALSAYIYQVRKYKKK